MPSLSDEVSTVTHSVSQILDHLLTRVANLEKELFHDRVGRDEYTPNENKVDSSRVSELENLSSTSSTESAVPGAPGIDSTPITE